MDYALAITHRSGYARFVMQKLSDLGENAAIARLARQLPAGGKGVRVAIGDDCAVVRVRRQCAFELLLTSDPVIEGAHFDATTAPEDIGRKALGRALSDIAAMGGEPLWALVDVAASRDLPAVKLERIYRGLGRCAARYGVAVVGGDLSKGPALELHVFAVGRAPVGTALLRSGARPGDVLFVTGALGGSRAGKHLHFVPRLAEGRWLRAGRWATALMDVSDGLAADLPRLLAASGAGAVVDLGALPIAPAARRIKDGRPPLDHALNDGEDFELLFTIPARRKTAFLKAWRRTFALPCAAIGGITRKAGKIEWIVPAGQPAPRAATGFDHFRRQAVKE
jgi:thiamine-monophosphate kinase